MKVLGVDFETQHDDAKTTPVTEIGAVEYEQIKPGSWKRGSHYDQLVYHPGYPPQTPEIVELTGITDEMLIKDGIEPRAALPNLINLVKAADYVIAHNKVFDETVFLSICGRLGFEAPKTPWLCSIHDIEYPKRYTCKKLSHLAWEHGYVFDKSKLHRAIDDVDLMMGFLITHYSIEDMIAYNAMPWVIVKADIPAPWIDGGVGKNNAAKRGYGYEKCRGTETPSFPKTWVKRLKGHQLEDEIKQAPFKVVVLTGRETNENDSRSQAATEAQERHGNGGAEEPGSAHCEVPQSSA